MQPRQYKLPSTSHLKQITGATLLSILGETGLMRSLCPACQQPQASGDLCTICERYLAEIEQPCPNCAAPMLSVGRCGECIKHPPAWEAMNCSWHFNGLSRFLIHRFKYQRDFSAGECLLRRWLLKYEHALKPDAIVAVPMHHKKQFQRGFNQAHWLAKNICTHWQVPQWNGVIRNQQTAPLEGLSKKERRTVLKGVFTLTSAPPKHVAIVDDVFTSGATLTELSHTLKKAGATYVSAWTLARTPLKP